jgi:diguanylate cyclase
LEELAARLRQLVARLSRDVGTHRSKIGLANRELAAVERLGAGELTDLVLLTVSQVLKLNRQLQTRLAEADSALQRQAAQIELHMAEARTDPLTRLPNRRALDDRLLPLLGQWRKQRRPFSVLMIDVDHFKQLNDRYGHLAGDQALRHIAEVLRATVSDGDLVARVGGEEFAVLAAECDLSAGCKLAELVRKAVCESRYQLGGQTVPLSVSVGLATARPDDDSVTLVRRADEALYCAKRNGRNCGYYHDGKGCRRIPQSDQSAEALDELCQRLRDRLAAVCTQQ